MDTLKVISETDIQNLVLFVNDEYLEIRISGTVTLNEGGNEPILYYHIDEVESRGIKCTENPDKTVFEMLQAVSLFYIDRKTLLKELGYTIC